jgi:hypothetical protein
MIKCAVIVSMAASCEAPGPRVLAEWSSEVKIADGDRWDLPAAWRRTLMSSLKLAVDY